ncbi:Guanylate cyclase soluble subunit alpha-2 [Chelonia mydas]|uniref:Guanylate cyclase soluble subunit alpha-2 n=1 Tax=Chelonia mydas TaxID=8469 RepID=M7C5V2_CHEMY|nr:Guanylate cyclase soluble subunit alpha-2 [Chelonia mydas]
MYIMSYNKSKTQDIVPFGNTLQLSCKKEKYQDHFINAKTIGLLKKEENFTFIPRSREELPDNFPKEIPGICYFLEVTSGQKQPKPSISSARVRKVSYNIGTMFLRETSL